MELIAEKEGALLTESPGGGEKGVNILKRDSSTCRAKSTLLHNILKYKKNSLMGIRRCGRNATGYVPQNDSLRLLDSNVAEFNPSVNEEEDSGEHGDENNGREDLRPPEEEHDEQEKNRADHEVRMIPNRGQRS